jgi:hypothetical protein
MSPDAIGVEVSMRAWDAINEIACRGYFTKGKSLLHPLNYGGGLLNPLNYEMVYSIP